MLETNSLVSVIERMHIIVLGCVWEVMIRYIRVFVQCFGEAVLYFINTHKKE